VMRPMMGSLRGACLVSWALVGCATDDEWTSRPSGPGVGSACDVVAQDCLDIAAPKCRVEESDGMGMTAFCDVAWGNDGEGDTCWAADEDPTADTCARGLDCATIGVPRQMPQPGKCYRFCDRPDGCDAGEACVILNDKLSPDARLYGICVDAICDFWDPSSCGWDGSCLRARLVDNGYAYMCYPSDARRQGEPCSSNRDCANGLGCAWDEPDDGTCQRWCGNAHPTCGAQQHCEIFNEEEDVGICTTD